ncbi:hypothetical protein [Acidisoma sp.]|uniref:hypothetical protein n=1 Tax=Acidisoma sp. TaxID=1872115 RepID=UPI003AFF7912
MSVINRVIKRVTVMKIMKVLAAGLTLTMLGGAAVSARAAQTEASQPAAASQAANANSDEIFAHSTFQRMPSNVEAEPNQDPKQLSFANFGQWDEAGSEN